MKKEVVINIDNHQLISAIKDYANKHGDDSILPLTATRITLVNDNAEIDTLFTGLKVVFEDRTRK